MYKLKINGMFEVWEPVISVIFHGEVLQFYFQVEFSKYMHVVGTAPTVFWLMKMLHLCGSLNSFFQTQRPFSYNAINVAI